MSTPLFELRSAIFSEDRKYRHMLRITWDEKRPLIAFVGVNPSSADEFADDPTMKRCKAFARRDGYGSLVMLNLFDFRTKDPSELPLTPSIAIGPKSDVGGQLRLLDPNVVVLCWGTNSRYGRDREVLGQILRYFAGTRLMCFGTNHDGSPKHPLYLKSTTPLVPFIPIGFLRQECSDGN